MKVSLEAAANTKLIINIHMDSSDLGEITLMRIGTRHGGFQIITTITARCDRRRGGYRSCRRLNNRSSTRI